MRSGSGWSRCFLPRSHGPDAQATLTVRILNGILWINRTGPPWKDPPERYGPVGTVPSRFYRWRKAWIWQRILEALQARADREGRVDRSLHFIDSTVVRAHQHAAGVRKAGRQRDGEALGRSRGGLSTKIHVRVEGLGKPVTFTLTGGEVHGSMAFPHPRAMSARSRPSIVPPVGNATGLSA